MSAKPPVWTKAELERDRLVAIEEFRRARMAEPLEDYLSHFEQARNSVENLLELTVDLSQLSDQAVEALTDSGLLEAVRYLAGPPISADDLKVLTDASLAPGTLRRNPAMAAKVIETVLLGLDRNRFPWIAEDREPTEAERSAAAMASAALIASRKVLTSRANMSKEAQEQRVKERLVAAGFQELPTRTIMTLDDVPDVGHFCGESTMGGQDIGGRKADIVIRLWDRRVMPMECKVSNSSTNSVKRLNNDAVVKAGKWLDEFGRAQTVPAAMLEGVFKNHNLLQAQERGLVLFWAHDLEPLVAFIERTRQP
jgi:hypothetical protein